VRDVGLHQLSKSELYDLWNDARRGGGKKAFNENLKKVAHACKLPSSSSLADLSSAVHEALVRLTVEESAQVDGAPVTGMESELDKVFHPYFTSSGGIMFALCPHNVVYAALAMLR
jgi:hypothetical protein